MSINMQAIEKILFVLNYINDKKELMLNDESLITIDFNQPIHKEIKSIEVEDILLKAEVDAKAIKIIRRAKILHHFPTDNPSLDYFKIKLTDNFDKYLNEIEGRINRQRKLARKKDIVLEIDFNEMDEIIINDYFLISRPNYDSDNRYFFKYMFDHANTNIRKEDIKNEENKEISRPPHKILNDLGFKGKLLQIFFRVSQNTIFFRNPVYRSDLENLKIDKVLFRLKK